MNSPLWKSESKTNTPSAPADEGSWRDGRGATKKGLTRWLVAATFVLLSVLASGLVLRFSVTLLSDPKETIVDGEIRPVSRSASQVNDAQRIEADHLRDTARSFDRRLLSRRQDRKWIYQSRELPDASHSRSVWHRQVDSIEQQLAEAEALQEKIDADAPEGTPGSIVEGSVLWHRRQFLERLREDAPATF